MRRKFVCNQKTSSNMFLRIYTSIHSSFVPIRIYWLTTATLYPAIDLFLFTNKNWKRLQNNEKNKQISIFYCTTPQLINISRSQNFYNLNKFVQIFIQGLKKFSTCSIFKCIRQILIVSIYIENKNKNLSAVDVKEEWREIKVFTSHHCPRNSWLAHWGKNFTLSKQVILKMV